MRVRAEIHTTLTKRVPFASKAMEIAFVGPSLGGANWSLAIWLMRDMARVATMQELTEEHPATVVHLSGHTLPTFNLCRGAETGLKCPSAGPFTDGDAAGHDQTSAGPL